MTDNKVPRIRFKGFTDDWEQRKLSTLIRKPITDGPHETPQLLTSGIPFISVEAIHDGIIDLKKCRGYISEYDDERFKQKYIPEIGDVFFTKAATIGRVAVVEKLGFNIWSPIGAIKPDFSKTRSKYLYYFLQTDSIMKEALLGSNSSSQYNLSMDTIENFTINIPKSINEQVEVSKILTNLDNLITLHQSKYDKLITIKKSMIEKMFPKKSFKIPEIRFKGFTDDWEQRKVEEIGDNFSTSNLSYADLTDDGKYKCVLYGDLYTKFKERIFDVKSRTNTEATEVEINDILFPTSTTVDNISLIAPSCVNQEKIRVGGDLFGIRPYKNINGNFVSYCINNFMPVKYSFAKQAQGLTIVHLQYNSIMIPTIDEQKKMSQLFINIDNLITLHQRKIEKLNIIKKSMLDKMFV